MNLHHDPTPVRWRARDTIIVAALVSSLVTLVLTSIWAMTVDIAPAYVRPATAVSVERAPAGQWSWPGPGLAPVAPPTVVWIEVPRPAPVVHVLG